MLPQYELFQYVHHWGDADFLKRIIADVYSALIDPSVIMDVAQWRTSLDKISPDIDEFEGALPSYALDTCIAFDELLSYIATEEVRHIHYLSEAVFDSVDMYVQEKLDLDPNDPLLEEKIASNPAMLTEEARQKEMLIELNDTVTFTQDYLLYLRSLNKQFEYLNDLDLIYDF